MLAALTWVPRGAAKAEPVTAEPLPEDLEAIKAQLPAENSAEGEDDENFEDENEEDEVPESSKGDGSLVRAREAAKALGSSKGQAGLDDLAHGLAELDMDRYDEEDGEIQIFANGGLGALYYSSNKDDPYLINTDEEDDEEEIEDLTIKQTDLLILAARNEYDVSLIEMWIYETGTQEDGESNMYVHHDIMLPAFPLSLAWLDCDVKSGGKGNLVAVGTMQPEIEIWDLDVLDEVEPAAVLGGQLKDHGTSSSKKSKKKKKKKQSEVKLKEGSHTDAVLGLSWNMEYRNVLASGSADNSVKIWDIVTQKCEHTLKLHTNQVQSVAWNQQEPTLLLSGSFDHTVALTDMRAPSHEALRWSVMADVESMAWNPHSPNSFVVSLEDGLVCCHDIRAGGLSSQQTSASTNQPVYTIHAHDKAVCSVSFNPVVPDLLATTSTDKMVKLWDTTENRPSCIASKNPKVGAIFTSSFCKDAPFLLALGGSKGNLHVWDTLGISAVAQKFGKYDRSQQRHV